MDYVVEYVKANDMNKNDVAPLNHMRLYKQMILPCELVGLIGRDKMDGYRNEIALSCLKQKIVFPVMPKPSKKTRELWNDFIKWLKEKNVITICNFSKMCESKYQISNDRKYVKEVRDNVTRVYCKSFERYGRERYIEEE